MTTKTRSFWTRLTDAVKNKRHKRTEAARPPDLPRVGDDGLLADPAEAAADVEFERDLAFDKPPRAVPRWSKRDQTLAKLQEGYEQVTQLIEQISSHLVTQAQASERICTSLEQLARSMGDVPAISRQQVQTLEQMAAQLEATGSRTERLAESMTEVPRIARTQGETLAGINRQLEMTHEQAIVAGQTMDKLGNAISMLGQANQAQSRVLEQMDAKSADRDEALNRLIARQGRRFVALFIVTTILAAAAITLGILALLLRTG